jgi:hypothetical protein
MRATITRTGGLAGVDDYLGTVDTNAIPPEHAARVRHAAEDLMNRKGRAGDIGADLYEYRVELTTEHGQQTVQITDVGDPEEPSDPALAELVRAVRRIA